MTKWDDRYGQSGFVYGTEPNEFLAAEAGRIPQGRVLCLAEGEGRNAVYLARLGHEVTAVDSSSVGLEKASKLAEENGVSITTQVADLASYEIEPCRWQGIVSIFAHVPSAVRKALHQQVVSGLAPGGVLILEAYTPRQPETEGKGGPPREQRDLFMSQAALQTELGGLSLQLLQEIDRQINEGQLHQGPGAVVQAVGVKATDP